MAGSPLSPFFGISGDYSWVKKGIAKVASIYNSLSSVIVMRLQIFLSATGDEGLFECRPCGEEKRVFLVTNSRSIFVYKTFFTHFHLQLSFIEFQCSVLARLNVTPTQLHPNNWAFVKAFEVLSSFLGWQASTGVFFSFFY